jgi:hypothetical protein
MPSVGAKDMPDRTTGATHGFLSHPGPAFNRGYPLKCLGIVGKLYSAFKHGPSKKYEEYFAFWRRLRGLCGLKCRF